MSKLKKLIIILLVPLVLFMFVPSFLPGTQSEMVEAATIKLNKTKATVTVGDTLKLKISGTSKTVKWKSSDKSIATINSKGVVTTISKGKVTITASVGDLKCKCTVTVKDAPDATTSATPKD